MGEVDPQTIAQLNAVMEERYSKLEERLEQYEQQLAILTMGFAEMASLVQALLSAIVNEDDDEKRKEFFKHVKEARETMMDNMLYATRNAEQSTDKFVAYSTGTAEGPSGSNDS